MMDMSADEAIRQTQEFMSRKAGEIDCELAQASCSLWWEYQSKDTATCAGCSSTIHRGAGCLCERGVLLCKPCFERVSPAPFQGRLPDANVSKCWFCKKGFAPGDADIQLAQYKGVFPILAEATVRVPRCRNCRSKEMVEKVAMSVGVVIGLALAIPLGTLVRNWSDRAWLCWTSGIISFFVFAGMSGILLQWIMLKRMGLEFSVEGNTVPSGSHPVAKKLTELGWSSEKPQGNFPFCRRATL